jgi:hypothetical protein
MSERTEQLRQTIKGMFDAGVRRPMPPPPREG